VGILMRLDQLAAAASLAAATAAALALGACYDPRLSDCTVRCASSDDCGPGQACTAQGYCAAPDHACTTGSSDATVDAATPPADAGKKPDAGPTRLVQLHVTVTTGGKVRVDGGGGGGTCDGDSPQGGNCSYSVLEATTVTLKATPRGGYELERWTSIVCSTAGETCVLTLFAPLTEVAARFVLKH
jgi:hypothetical protein